MGRQITHIVVHCSATPNGRRVTSEDIDGWHKAAGFRRTPALIGRNEPRLRHIGYHFVVYVDGSVRMGRGLEEPGAHVAGHNAKSIGICMAGTSQYTPAQWASLAELVQGLKARERYPDAKVCGHRDFSPDLNRDGRITPNEWIKTCPGFDVATWAADGYKPLKANILEV